MLVCHQLRDETPPLFYGENTLRLEVECDNEGPAIRVFQRRLLLDLVVDGVE